MELIFDQQRTLKDGASDGGMGKSEMYKNREKELHEVQFACKPFNKLFWKLWGVFSKYNKRRWAASRTEDTDSDSSAEFEWEDSDPGAEPAPKREPSVSPSKLVKIFESALRLPGWKDDKVADQFPRHSSMSTSRKPLPQMESENPNLDLGKRPWISEGTAPDVIKVGAWAKRQKRE